MTEDVFLKTASESFSGPKCSGIVLVAENKTASASNNGVPLKRI